MLYEIKENDYTKPDRIMLLLPSFVLKRKWPGSNRYEKVGRKLHAHKNYSDLAFLDSIMGS